MRIGDEIQKMRRMIWVLASTRALETNEFSSKFPKSSFFPHQKILFLSKVMAV